MKFLTKLQNNDKKNLETIKSDAHAKYFEEYRKKTEESARNFLKEFKPNKKIKAEREKEAERLFAEWKEKRLENFKLNKFNLNLAKLYFELDVVLQFKLHFYEKQGNRNGKREIISKQEAKKIEIYNFVRPFNIKNNPKGYSSIYAAQKAEGLV